MADYAVQRANMVESQVRPSDITDRRVLRAMQEVPREVFVPSELRGTAYRDEDLPVMAARDGRAARYLMAPRVLAKLIQQLELAEDSRVLEVGCATGYATALLARIAASVVAVECEAALAAEAARNLAVFSLVNTEVATGPLAEGWPAGAPYDAILVNGAVAFLPAPLLDQLKDGGRLVAVFRDGAIARATQWRRIGGLYDARPVFDAAAPLLPGFEPKPAFSL